jgi:hypothetical protein
MFVRACPTTDAWKAGDDQPMDAAPAYDCSTRSFEASVSADGKTLTFLVDDGGQRTPGQLSLAIIPVLTDEAPGVGTEVPTDATQPYSLDIAKPDPSSLLVTLSAPLPTSGGSPSTVGGATTTSGGTGGGGSTSGTTSGIGTPSLTGSGGLPAGQTGSGVSDAPPVVAPSTPAGTESAPVAVATPRSDNTAHNAALALLILMAMAIAATGNGQLQRAPRLLGGGARHAAARGAVAGAAAVGVAGAAAAAGSPDVPLVPMSPYGSRGLGRFAKVRTEPPRPLL